MKFLLVSMMCVQIMSCAQAQLQRGFYYPFLSLFSQLPDSFPLIPSHLKHEFILEKLEVCFHAKVLILHPGHMCHMWEMATIKLTSISCACKVQHWSVPFLCSVLYQRQMTPLNRTSQVTLLPVFSSC